MTKLGRVMGLVGRWAACGLAVVAAGCGGGGGGGGGSGSSSTGVQGSVSVSLAGGASPGVDHVWVTVNAVALNADADKPWSGSDSSWLVVRLSAPTAIDLASLVNGSAQPLVIGQPLPAGTYGQMRLLLTAHDATLTKSASDAKLSYNDQVDYTDSSGTAHHVPLELPDVGLGLRVDGPFVVQGNLDTDLTLQWDAERSLARFTGDDGVDRFTWRPDLRAYDAADTGAIVGVVDKSQFCAAGVRSDTCIYDVEASALLASADGRFKRSVRSSPVQAGSNYALFSLYPLPALGQGQTFDVVIRGRNMRTMVVRNVPAAPAGLLAALPTTLGADPNNPTAPSPMVPVLVPGGEAQASLAAPMANAGARLLFGQTLPGDTAPMEIATANTDPFSGQLARPVPLPSGALRVSDYRNDIILAFSDVSPQEGDGGFSVMALGTRYQDPSVNASVAVTPGANVAFTAREPSAKAGLGSGTLTVSISSGNGKYDAAELVVSDPNGIVTTRDVSAQLSGGSVSLTLPAGAQAASLGGTAVYAVAVRAWKRSAPSSSLQWARAPGAVDLRSATTASASVTLP